MILKKPQASKGFKSAGGLGRNKVIKNKAFTNPHAANVTPVVNHDVNKPDFSGLTEQPKNAQAFNFKTLKASKRHGGKLV